MKSLNVESRFVVRIITIVLFLFSRPLAQTSAEMWSIGVNELGKNNFDFALFCFSELVKADPMIEDNYNSVAKLYPGFFFYRGLAKYGNKDYIGCLKDMNRSLEVKDSSESFDYKLNAYIYKSKSKGMLEDWYGALNDINKAIELNPKAGALYDLRASTKLQLDDDMGACLDWSKAGELGFYEAYDRIKKFCK